jgi:hypothetical protein
MSRPDFTRPQWDRTAYNLPPAEAARTRLVLGQQKQRWAYRMMSGQAVTPPWLAVSPAELQRQAGAEMAEAWAATRWLDTNPPCARCNGRGFLFLTPDREALPVWCDACDCQYHSPQGGAA